MPEKNQNHCYDCGNAKNMLFSTPNSAIGPAPMSVAVCIPCFQQA
jgi:hypothetical protein